jgi:hypothetical protein
MEEPTILIDWKGQEFEFSPKSPTWYWTIGILSIGSATAAFIIGNILFGIILLLAGITVSLLGSRKPAMHHFKITNRGIYVGDQVFKYDTISRFAMDDHLGNGVPEKLYFELKVGIVKVMTIPLAGVDYRKVRMELKNHNIEEAEHLDSFNARVSDWMGIG